MLGQPATSLGVFARFAAAMTEALGHKLSRVLILILFIHTVFSELIIFVIFCYPRRADF